MGTTIQTSTSGDLRAAYIDLLRKTLTMTLWDAQDGSQQRKLPTTLKARAKKFIKRFVGGAPEPSTDNLRKRIEGRDWPKLAHTMIGTKRMDNLQSCVENALRDGIPGDLIETGVWRGGACIFMRGILKAYEETQRTVWVADSFEGLPAPDAARYPADAGDIHHTLAQLAVSLDDVKANFSRYGLLDDQVRFLKGWFKDTLPDAPIQQLAVARLDGDMYESTIDALASLYPKLSAGGYLIVDDYGAVPACAKAVEDYRNANGIKDPVQVIDWGGVFWRRSK